MRFLSIREGFMENTIHLDLVAKALSGPPEDLRFLDQKQVTALTTNSRSLIYTLPNFPKPVKLLYTRRVVWLQHEVLDWMKRQVAARDNSQQQQNDLAGAA